MKTYDMKSAPDFPATDVILFSEPGRVLDLKSQGGNYNVCYRSFSYAVAKSEYGVYSLHSHSGLGFSEMRITKEAADILAMLESDARFFLCHSMKEAHDKAKQAGYDKASREYTQAFADGKLKKRKVRGQALVKVFIEA